MNTTSSGDSVSCVAQSDCRSTVAPNVATIKGFRPVAATGG